MTRRPSILISGMFLAHRFMVITIEIERGEVSIDDLAISGGVNQQHWCRVSQKARIKTLFFALIICRATGFKPSVAGASIPSKIITGSVSVSSRKTSRQLNAVSSSLR